MKSTKIKTISKKIIKYVIVLIFIILGLYNLLYTLGKQYDEKYNIKIFGYQFGVVTGNAMEPEIEHNDIVIYKKEKDEQINEKDIIIIYKNDELVIRRVMLKKTDGKYITKGDNYLYNDPDELINSDIEGKVYKIIPNLRKHNKNSKVWSDNRNYYMFFNIIFCV